MAEKDQEQVYPIATANGQAKSDVESAAVQSKELRRKRRIKCLAYVAAFAVFQTIIILVFALTVMRIKNPKFRVRSIAIDQNLAVSSSTTSPSFYMSFNAEVTVKNTNFGHFKFENSTITFSYMGTPVGEGLIIKGRARARSTKKMNITVDVSSDKVSSNSNLGSDTNSGILTLSSHSKLSGKVHLMKVIKKKKFAEMNCTMNINLVNKVVQDIKCN